MPLGLVNIGRQLFKRGRKGLYAGRMTRFGNKVSEDGENKSRRRWLPNAHWAKLYSVSLQRTVSIRVTAAALRTVDKYGGLDEYLVRYPRAAEESDVAAELREAILAARAAAGPQAPRARLPAGAPAAAHALAAETQA